MSNIITRAYILAAAVLALAGVGAIAASGFVDTMGIRVGLELGGVGFLALALLAFQMGRAEERAEERHRELLARLNEVEEHLKSLEEKPQHHGVAIADLLGSGMKWYQDYLNRDKGTDAGPDA
jgi:hypothetical protein